MAETLTLYPKMESPVTGAAKMTDERAMTTKSLTMPEMFRVSALKDPASFTKSGQSFPVAPLSRAARTYEHVDGDIQPERDAAVGEQGQDQGGRDVRFAGFPHEERKQQACRAGRRHVQQGLEGVHRLPLGLEEDLDHCEPQ